MTNPNPVQARSDLANFILDLEDEDCPRHDLHLAAYQGDLQRLEAILNEDDLGDGVIDSRIRPFQATPLRLAATGARLRSCCSM